MNNQEKQVHIRLPEAAHRRLRIQCVTLGVSVQDYLKKLIMQDLENSTTAKLQTENKTVIKSKYIEAIKLNPIFEGLSHNELGKISSAIVRLQFKKGQIIEREEERSSMFYIVEEGVVFIYKASPVGKEFIIDVRVKGESFASLATLSNMPYLNSARAAEDTILLALKREDFITFFSHDINIMAKVIQNEAAKLLSAYTKLIDFTSNTAKRRLIKILLMLSSKCGHKLNYSHLEIAEMSGTTIETVSRVLSRLKRTGVIGSDHGSIVILKQDILQSMTWYYHY